MELEKTRCNSKNSESPGGGTGLIVSVHLLLLEAGKRTALALVHNVPVCEDVLLELL